MEIVYEDEDLLAINKPAGLLSVPGKTPEKYNSAQSILRDKYLGITAIHRLDMATSGLMLFAKHKAAERFYKQQFEQRLVQKTYIAVTYGSIYEEKGSISFPLFVDWPNRPKQRVNYARGKKSLTHYEVIQINNNQTRLFLYPHTGRSHQLRVHLATIGHAIIGDKLYSGTHYKNTSRLHLHSQSINITAMDGTPLNLYKKADF